MLSPVAGDLDLPGKFVNTRLTCHLTLDRVCVLLYQRAVLRRKAGRTPGEAARKAPGTAFVEERTGVPRQGFLLCRQKGRPKAAASPGTSPSITVNQQKNRPAAQDPRTPHLAAKKNSHFSQAARTGPASGSGPGSGSERYRRSSMQEGASKAESQHLRTRTRTV